MTDDDRWLYVDEDGLRHFFENGRPLCQTNPKGESTIGGTLFVPEGDCAECWDILKKRKGGSKPRRAR